MATLKGDEISILHYLYFHPAATTSKVAKDLFDPQSDRELRNADRKVRHYLEDKHGHLVEIERVNGKKRFSVKAKKLFFGLGKIDVVTGSEEVSLGLGQVMVYQDPDGGMSVATVTATNH